MKLRTTFLLAVLCFLFYGLDAQVIYQSEIKENADKLIFVETEEGARVDMLVYETEWKSDARSQSGIWYFTEWRTEADFSIFFTEFKSEADLVIRYTEIKSDAGPQ